MKSTRYILPLILLAFAACSPEKHDPVVEAYCPIQPGDAVCFSMDREAALSTKAFPDQPGYTPVVDTALYRFTVEMYQEGTAEAIGHADYVPLEGETDGTLALVEEQTPLLWEDNVNAYGFKAFTGVEDIVAGAEGYCDQRTPELWTMYDRLVGFAAVGSDDREALNHHKISEWFAQNKADFTAAGMLASEQDLMKIPLYLQHQHSLITVILKAAEGVRREDLQFLTQEENIEMNVFQKSGTGDMVAIRPLAEQAEVEYEADINGPAGTFETTCYHAIVEPYNYIDVAETDPICTVNLSGQKFSFYASSDSNYNSYKEASLPIDERAEFEKAYNLEPGKHVVITATLSRESRKILITAYVEDWVEVVTSTICDDYGKNGDPIQISTVDQLRAALADPEQNLTGNVLLVTSDLVLPEDWNGVELKCMLNLAGRSINTSRPMFSRIASSGSVVNGTVNVTADVPYAMAQDNYGTIERVSVTADDGVKAEYGGMVKTNWRTIYNCSTSLSVYGSPVISDQDNPFYVGGIAAESKQQDRSTVKPIIDGCTVDAKVGGNEKVALGGGIVGNATGRVTNNIYEYGITLSQDANRFKNTVGGHEGFVAEQILTESNNSYPDAYSGIIDCQAELSMLFDNVHNALDKTYRIAGDFTVDQTWDKAICDHALGLETSGNVLFALEGNGKTITLTSSDPAVSAPMLFTNIQNKVSNLTICVDKPIFRPYSIGSNAADVLNIDDFSSVAALAYAVVGGRLENVKVYTVGDAYIMASNAAGIAVWALKGAVLDGCEFHGVIKGQEVYTGTSAENVTKNMTSLRQGNGVLASGGIVAAAELARFSSCAFHDGSTASIPSTNADRDRTYFGGIVGAVVDSASDDGKPKLVLEDCSSYLSGTSDHMGAVLGYSIYREGAPVASHSGVDSGNCQGNWWRTTENYAVAVKMDLKNDAQTIGKRNSVTPTLDTSWFE